MPFSDAVLCTGAALGPLLAGLISPTGWNNVFYMLISADILACLVRILGAYRWVLAEGDSCPARLEPWRSKAMAIRDSRTMRTAALSSEPLYLPWLMPC